MFRNTRSISRTISLGLLAGTILFHQSLYPQQRPAAEVYRILGISVEGNRSAESAAILANAGLKVGDELLLPGDQIRQAVTRLWALNIFSDVQVLIENKVDDGVYLLVKVAEYPRLSRVEITGEDEVDEDDITKAINLVNGQVLSPSETNRAVRKIKELYEKEGYLLTEVQVDTMRDDSTDQMMLNLNIDEGPEVEIGRIRFSGNTVFDEGDLKGAMEETKEKTWWKFWSSPNFDRKKYDEDKTLILKEYRKNGYIDAEIVSDSISYSENKEEVNIHIAVSEGNQYAIRTITWEGVSVYTPKQLEERLGFFPGNIYNEERFEQNLRGNPEQFDVASLYLDNGYLTFNLEPEVKRVGDDSLDIVIHVYERNKFQIGKVDITGNTKTRDYVIRRELYTRPGDYFDRSKIIRSLRQLQQLNYFNPEKLTPDTKLVDDKTVDVVFGVEEKSSDNVNASIGYSQAFGVTGALGFTINNFSISEPLRGGAGQVFNFEWQFGEGARFRTFSLGFTEPWLYNTPTTLGVNLFDTRQQYVYDIQQTGVSVRVGRRLKWPDDFFRADWTFRFQGNNVFDNGGVTIYRTGKTTQYGITQGISRNSTDSPIFPASGSNIAFSVELSGGPILPGNVDYHKWLFNSEWFTPLLGSSRLVLYAGSSLGYLGLLGGEEQLIPPLEYFYMGGVSIGGYVPTTSLRGYEDRTVGPKDEFGNETGGRVMAKHTAELRLAVTLNPIPIYLLGFAEGGNVFSDFKRADMFDLKRSYGFGARLLINPIGLVGFDYGYGADDISPLDGNADGWRFHFQFGRGF